MKHELLGIRDAAPGLNLADAPACNLLAVLVHPGQHVELVGSKFTAHFTLDPVSAELLVARLSEALAGHLAGPAEEPSERAAP